MVIPFSIVSNILRPPVDIGSHPEKTKNVSFYCSEQDVINTLFVYIYNTPAVSHVLERSLLKILYANHNGDISSLPFGEEDILTEVFLKKLKSAERNGGLACPEDWSRRSDQVWLGWLIVSLQNQLRDILRSPKNQPKTSLNTPTFEDSRSHLIDRLIDQNGNTDQIEEEEIKQQVNIGWELTIELAHIAPRISPMRKLCWLMLNAPKSVTNSHFELAETKFSRPLDNVTKLWTEDQSNYEKMNQSDDLQSTRTRAYLTWLLFGPEYVDADDFQTRNSSVFNQARDNLRQNITRANKDIHQRLMPIWVWYPYPDEYELIWKARLTESIIEMKLNPLHGYNEQTVCEDIQNLQKKYNGLPVRVSDFKELTSLITPPYCLLPARVNMKMPNLSKRVLKQHWKRFSAIYELLKTELPFDIQNASFNE